ncbi:MBL fold metallo-hydrolase [Corallococcus macrosporus]|uniref:Metallo-beta-lactamase family protein n=1 Tax=Myxococcus fulvus (strain ATCC BAA-855 / HW-1) TaxID=483219 RepID=F8CAQ7_MYXFH|nr:MBL fold hydrolase [Corallococcus macrosporus]AEI67109.1 metallo-beta-lactamase family protein [Corallococcus macrosporus]
MYFQAIKTPGLAHVAYVLGSEGEALVVDPGRDVGVYLDVLRSQRLRLRYVLQTHRQEDFVQGTAELARLSGAQVVAGRHPINAHAGMQVGERERLHLGGLTLVALHTPGHTPESTSWAVYLEPHHTRAWGVFTGDALFAGETGRTDLQDPERTYENAGLLYDALHQKVLPLGDQALILPAHGPGSVCGGDIADREPTTLGLERQSNPVFLLSRSDFIQRKVRERLPRPGYFTRMEEVNLHGGHPLLAESRAITFLGPGGFQRAIQSGQLLDAREPEAFAGGHVPGALNVWMNGLSVFGAQVARPPTPLFLILPEHADPWAAVLALARVGLDEVHGVLAGGFGAWRDAGLPVEHSGTLTPEALFARAGHFQTLDVRGPAEFEQGHIPQARHVYVGDLEARLPQLGLREDLPLAVTCSVGHRAGLAVSILLRHGFQQVSNVLGGMKAWTRLELPVRRGPPRPDEAVATQPPEPSPPP